MITYQALRQQIETFTLYIAKNGEFKENIS